jgi:cystathionine beta-lyase/cystathionine gamma-synthase
MKLATKLIHAGEPRPRILGAVAMPIFASATYEYSGEASYHDVRYIRLNNTPTHLALHGKLAALENGDAALVTSSGMSAISTTVLALLTSGEHILAQDCLYGGTLDLFRKDLPAIGISADLVPGDSPAAWELAVRPTTRAIYVEAMANPLLEVADLEAAVAFARQRGLISIIDSTFASPVNFRPLELGFDLAIHSATKYLNGHTDLVAGAVIGRRDLIERVKRKLDHFGGSLDPQAAYLLHRGLKTLNLRVRAQNDSALVIARMLEKHPAVARVNYAGLETHPRHARARALFSGFGGVLSFELKGGQPAVRRFLERVRLPAKAPSLGGVETLLTLPSETSHRGLSPEERKKAGISETLIRMSVGIEDNEDLLADLAQALAT